MKTRTGIVLPILAIAVGLGMIVAAGVIVSNQLTYENKVAGIVLTSTWSSQDCVIGAQNSFTVSYASTASPPTSVIVFRFGMTGIVPGDVVLQYNDGTGWKVAVLTTPTSNTLVGPTASIGATSGVVNYALTYNTIGTYALNIWAEAI